jgi:hypothetical protein
MLPATAYPRRVAALVAVAAALVGCGDDGPGGTIVFTGGYEDWDSTRSSFAGIFEATVREVADPSNHDVTAPNGRSTLMLPDTGVSQVTYVQDAAGYLPARYTVDPAAVAGPYQVFGITEARIASEYAALFGGAWDPGAAQVLIEVRAYPSLDPADGVTVTVIGAGYHRDDAGAWAAGATIGDGGAHVLFPNVPVSASGTVALGVDAGGRTCRAAERIYVAAGELALTTVACDD